MAGYSATPLVKKIGIKEQFRVLLVNAPADFQDELQPLPAGVTFVTAARKSIDVVLLFVRSQSELDAQFPKLAAKLAPAGMLWVAWPKKSAGLPTDLSFNIVQQAGLAAGLVDTKVCAIDEVWSGLKFVIRVKDRPRRSV